MVPPGSTNKEADMADYFTDLMGMIWVQPGGPNTRPYPLFCHDLGDVDEPLGDVTTTLCQNAMGQWEVAHRSQGAPSSSTFTIETWLRKTRMWLQKQVERRCEIPVYVHWSECPPADVFLNYEEGLQLQDSYITNKSLSDSVKRRGEEGQEPTMVGQAFDLTSIPIPPHYWKLVKSIPTIAEEEALNDIAFCNAGRCDGPCGAQEDIGTDGIIVADFTTDAAADVWFTENGWGTGTAATTPPYAVNMAIASAVCFYIDRDAVRHVVARGTLDGGPADIAYSDDAGLTAWTIVDVGDTNDEHAVHGGALFALDQHNIWLCTDQGNIFKSEDAAVSWPDQNAPIPVGGAEALYCIDFVDSNFGMCVGGTTGVSSVLLTTTDGGEHWTLGTGPAAAILTGVSVIDSIHAWVTTEAGALYYTDDFGLTWTARVLPSTPDALGDVDFLDRYNGTTAGFETVSGAELATIWRTFDGGFSWEEYQHDTAFDSAATYGLNSVVMLDPNHIFAVGEPVDSLGLIMELSAKGSV
jgi:photosystem II stability/assembly factor-like uncharacterized protein